MKLFSPYFSSRRGRGIVDHPSALDFDIPDWVGTADDPVWNRIAAEVETFTPIKDVATAAHECQVAIANLAVHGEQPGPIGEATSQALLGLVMDIHHECRRIQHSNTHHPDVQFGVVPKRRLGIRHWWNWVNDPVGAGEPVSYQDLNSLRRTHRFTAALRLACAVMTSALLMLGAPGPAFATLVLPFAMGAFIRYRTNAEAAVTFRARYLTCWLSHIGDSMVLLGAFVWSVNHARLSASLAPVLAIVVMLVGALGRAGALQVGVYNPRRRIDSFVRTTAMALGIGLTAVGVTWGFFVTLGVVAAATAWETREALRAVWNAGGTEFVLALRTEGGITSEVFDAPHPRDANAVSPFVNV